MRRWVFLAAFLLLAGSAAPALAQSGRGSAQPLDRIIEGIRQSRSGSFYDAEGPFLGPDGRMHYHIKWMTPEGRVIWLDTDAQSGRVLGTDSGGRRGSYRGGEERDSAPDRERFRRHDEERNRFERDRSFPNPFERGGDESGFGPGQSRPDENGRGDRGFRRYDRGGFGGRILPGSRHGHRDPDER